MGRRQGNIHRRLLAQSRPQTGIHSRENPPRPPGPPNLERPNGVTRSPSAVDSPMAGRRTGSLSTWGRASFVLCKTSTSCITWVFRQNRWTRRPVPAELEGVSPVIVRDGLSAMPLGPCSRYRVTGGRSGHHEKLRCLGNSPVLIDDQSGKFRTGVRGHCCVNVLNEGNLGVQRFHRPLHSTLGTFRHPGKLTPCGFFETVEPTCCHRRHRFTDARSSRGQEWRARGRDYDQAMVKRGSYAKGVATKEDLLAAALEVVGQVGYGRSSVREIAEQVGITHAGLMHHFGSKDVLFREVLRKRDEVSRARAKQAGIELGTPEQLTTTIRSNAEVPGLVQLYVRLSGEASEDRHAAHEFFSERYRELRSLGAERVRAFQAEGKFPAALDPERIATLVLAAADGLQLQWLYERDLDMSGLIEYMFEALGLVEVTGADADEI